MALTRRAQMKISTAEPGIHAITVVGTLDAYTGLRLRRLISARLTLVRSGRDATTRCLVIDLGPVDRATGLGLEAVIQAARDTSRIAASFTVIGDDRLFEILPAEDRAAVSLLTRHAAVSLLTRHAAAGTGAG
jgi:hypothetical protein